MMLSTKTFLHIAGTIFTIVGTAHLLRLLNGWEVVLGGWTLPVWISFLGMIIPWYLAYNAFVLAGKNKK